MQTQPELNPNKYSGQSKPQQTGYSQNSNLNNDGALDKPERENVASTAILIIVVAALAIGVVWFAGAYYKDKIGGIGSTGETSPAATSAPGTNNTDNTNASPNTPDTSANVPAANGNSSNTNQPDTGTYTNPNAGNGNTNVAAPSM